MIMLIDDVINGQYIKWCGIFVLIMSICEKIIPYLKACLFEFDVNIQITKKLFGSLLATELIHNIGGFISIFIYHDKLP